VAGQSPALTGVEIGGAGTIVTESLAGPEKAPAATRRRCEQGLGGGGEVQIAPEVEAEQPILGIDPHAEEAENQRFGTEDGAIHASGALFPEDRVLFPEPQQVDVEGIGRAVALALREVKLGTLEGEAVGRIGQGGLGLGSGEARKLRQELGATRPHQLRQFGGEIGEVEERARSSRSAVMARYRPGLVSWWQRLPAREFAIWSWFWMKFTNDVGPSSPAGVPRGFRCHAYRWPW
jgi:hypothetical protein